MGLIVWPDQDRLDPCETELPQAPATIAHSPNNELNLRHWFGLLPSLSGSAQTRLQSGQLDPTLKHLVGVTRRHTQSRTDCTAHAGYNANRLGVEAEKIAAVFTFETSTLSGAEERAVRVT